MTTIGETAQSTSRIRTGTVPVESKLETPSPACVVSLESILCTEELLNRPWRPPDYEKENSALAALVCALTDSPQTILQTLADKVLELLHADSAGLSLLTKDEKRFYWAAIAGAWSPHIGGGTPRDFGPCGDVLDHNIPMLFTHWQRRYPYLQTAIPRAEEGLLAPFYVNGKAVGTIWAIAHSNCRKFDAEDLRLLESMGRFASAAYQAAESTEDLRLEIAARETAETALRELANGLEGKIRRLVDSNIIGIFMWCADGRITDANEAYLRIIGCDRGDLVAGRLSWRDLTPPEWRSADDRRAAQLEAGGTAQPYEKEYLRSDGSRVPVLVGATAFEGTPHEGVGFVLDLTDRKRVERAYTQVQTELAHANRVATIGAPDSFDCPRNQPADRSGNHLRQRCLELARSPIAKSGGSPAGARPNRGGRHSSRRCHRPHTRPGQEGARAKGQSGDQRGHPGNRRVDPTRNGEERHFDAYAAGGEPAGRSGRSSATATGDSQFVDQRHRRDE
jgi:PAS domain S-box-containing protein